jgi:hypothetical protein
MYSNPFMLGLNVDSIYRCKVTPASVGLKIYERPEIQIRIVIPSSDLGWIWEGEWRWCVGHIGEGGTGQLRLRHVTKF